MIDLRDPTEIRIRTRRPQEEAKALINHVLGPKDFDVLVQRDTRVLGPAGELLAVFRKNIVPEEMAQQVFPIFSSIRGETSNRTYATGAPMVRVGKQTRAFPVESNIIGSFEATTSRFPACRQTIWTTDHPEEFKSLFPYFRLCAEVYRQDAPEHYARQWAHTRQANESWVIPGTPFTTCTVNNTYATAAHQDKGDFKEGLSLLSVFRRGDWRGGQFILPEFRVAFDIDHGDLLAMNPHLIHGNVPIQIPGSDDLTKRHADFERVSIVLYEREQVITCGTPAEELAKWQAYQKV